MKSIVKLRAIAPHIVIIIGIAIVLSTFLAGFRDYGAAQAQPTPAAVDARTVAEDLATPDAAPSSPATEIVPAAPTSPATTPTVPTSSKEALGFARQVYDLWLSGDKKAAVGLAMVLVVFLLRTYVFGWVNWFQTKLGGLTFTTGLGIMTTIGLAWAAHAPVNIWKLFNGVATVAVAAGIWGWLKDHIPWLAKLTEAKKAAAT